MRVAVFFRSAVLSASSLIADATSEGNEVKLFLQRTESDVLAFRDEIERVYSSRCDPETLDRCNQSSYNDCSSTYPNQQCIDSDELIVSACGDGESCNALWDKTQTVVRIPGTLAHAPLGNPTDPQVIESICYSHLAEPYMIENYKRGTQMHFGSAAGAIRSVPAIQSEVCGEYDHRRRPWFVAASSGPKDVVLVIDVSASMKDYDRIDLVKRAATTVVDTLTVADRVAIVTFSNEASQLGGYNSLIRATRENKERLIELINDLEASSGTNFYDAFSKTFDALLATIKDEEKSGCNIAVLFMTDGVSTSGPGDEEVIDLVNEGTALLSADFDRDTKIFTYSLGELADHDVTKKIACNTGGIWQPIGSNDDLVSAMSSYYKIYAMGLGEGGNENFVSWVEEYDFHSTGKKGTSASAPVYDRTVSPPHFLGVASIDVFMDAIDQGDEASVSTTLDRFVLLSAARCPKIELNDLELDALRFLGGGEGATCGASNAAGVNFDNILPEKCPLESNLPDNLWANTELLGKGYKERACCQSGDIGPSDACSAQENTVTETLVKLEEFVEGYLTNDSLKIEPEGGDKKSATIVGVLVAAHVLIACLVLLLICPGVNARNDGPGDKLYHMPSTITENVTIIKVPASAPSLEMEHLLGNTGNNSTPIMSSVGDVPDGKPALQSNETISSDSQSVGRSHSTQSLTSTLSHEEEVNAAGSIP